MHAPLTRRRFLAAALSAQSLPPVRAITRGPYFHWFGYYDKLQFDPSSRYVLGMETSFEHRSPTPKDTLRLGMVDLHDNNRWIHLADSHAWNWQQGCMLQWLPGSAHEVIFNDYESGQLVSHILNVRTARRRTIPFPIYAVSPDARWAVSTDFRRLNDDRPGYGYPYPDPNANTLVPDNSGVWHVDLVTGKHRLIVSMARAASFGPYPLGEWTDSKHRFNHLLVNPSGTRFIFLHRRRPGGPNPKAGITRMFTARPDGTDLYVVDPWGDTSHFIWRDDTHILAWAYHPSHNRKFYLYTDKSDKVEVVAPDLMPVNGHCSYLPGNRWILNDTYPDKERLQHVYLYDTAGHRRVPLGSFLSPPEYAGEWRCDTHPRFSPGGKLVCIDSPHQGGRQLHLIDISGVLA